MKQYRLNPEVPVLEYRELGYSYSEIRQLQELCSNQVGQEVYVPGLEGTGMVAVQFPQAPRPTLYLPEEFLIEIRQEEKKEENKCEA